MSVRNVLTHARRPHFAGRAAAPVEPTRHEWIRELALVLAGLLVYFGVRAATSDDAAVADALARSVVHLEQMLGLARESSLRGLIIDHHALVTVANWVYIWGHWPLIAVSAAWLLRHRPEGYRPMRTGSSPSGDRHDHLPRVSGRAAAPDRDRAHGTMTSHSHAYRTLQPPSLMDRYAAVPSLHFGWDLLVGLTLARFHPRTAGRVLGALMPVAMALAVVMTANHYVLDVIVGGIVAMAGLALASGFIRARDRHAADAFRDGAAWSTRRC